MRVANSMSSGGALVLEAALVFATAPWQTSPPAEGAQGSGEQKERVMAFPLTAAAFENGGWIPRKYTCDGADVSPALAWGEPPAGTQSFALIVDDPDAPTGTWVHWVLYDLPGRARAVPEGLSRDRELPDGTRQGRNDFGKIGYNGPCPPRGAVHRYFFKLYALNLEINLPPGATKSELEQAMTNHVVAEAEILGRFQH
ncbi:MAG: YbhB/YbcL family Raf kinase inhibitor-like protein [Candidatus Acidiferrales bacterium]